MAAAGKVDFPLDAMDVKITTSLLETVDRLVNWIPVVREAVGATTDLATVNLHLTGSPYDANVNASGGVRPAQRLNGSGRARTPFATPSAASFRGNETP
jgi:hypothetical protein